MVRTMVLLSVLFFCGKVFAFGLDVGPVHVHDTNVKVGSSIDITLVVDKIVRDEEKREHVRRIYAHHKGSEDDKFLVKVDWADLDDRSQEILRGAKTDEPYDVSLEKLEDDWKLVKIRRHD
jgi:hypothetical protein